MKTKAPIPITLLFGKITPQIIEFYFEFVHLKQMYRQGWLMRGIPEARCESVAEHSFAVAVLALFLAEEHFPELDLAKLLRMALIHDFGEVYAGDIIPGDKVTQKEKHQLELNGISHILSRFPQGGEYLKIWQEFEEGKSPEASFIRQIDRLEMALQASVYEYQHPGDYVEFFESARKDISSAELMVIFNHLESLRK